MRKALAASIALGLEFLGIGVQPQTLVTPTLQDFRAGKDAVLEAALAELRQDSKKN